MTIRNLDSLFAPRSIALIGASRRKFSVGATVMRNMLAAGFRGRIFPVNPKYREVSGIRAFARIEQLPQTPDLAVICTPPASVPQLIAELGARGTKAAIVLTAGLGASAPGVPGTITQAMLNAARPHLLRILGPNCVGMLSPAIGLNASFAHTQAAIGNIAFVSQSGALITAVLDWANAHAVGFSHCISVGECADIDIADLIDYLGHDPKTRSILLYMESIHGARKFLTAARAAARNKPLIVVKAGRVPEGAKAAASHTGALAGADDVFDAAIRRAGMLRVDTLQDLFAAAETLSHVTRYSGERLAILTNGGGAGVLAADEISARGGTLSALSPETIARLDRVLPVNWSHGNPIDIIGDAPIERYVDALKILDKDPQVDAIAFMHAPTAIVPAKAIASACAPIAKQCRSLVLSCWLGAEAVANARQQFHALGIADYGTPEETVRAFLQLVTYHKNQSALQQLPASEEPDIVADLGRVREILSAALDSGRTLLSAPESSEVLSAYGIAVAPTLTVADINEAVERADQIGFPLALKILSPDITHKSDVGGVVLDLADAAAVREAGSAMLKRVAEQRPGARVRGFTLQRMVRKPRAHELIAGISVDPLFGPVILFGQGGTAVEIIADRAVSLPPLNAALAHELISRTRVAKLLAGYRDRPPADEAAVMDVLRRLSQLVIDVPQIVELDINPLLADADGALALDARIRIERSNLGGADRLAIRPYPSELIEQVDWRGAALTLRPIRPDDAERHLEFLRQLEPDDIRMRVFHSKRHIAPSELARLTQIDYEREMAFIALRDERDRGPRTIGVVRTVTDPENETAEFALIVRSDIKGQGIGRLLLEKIVRYCRTRGTRAIAGDVLRENIRMLKLARELEFTQTSAPEPGVVRVTLPLN
jgi:acetyltransferase